MTIQAEAPPITPQRILDLGLQFQQSKVLLSAVELGLFSELANGPLTAAELADRVGLHPRGVLDFLDTLVALGLLDRSDSLYTNTFEAATFLDQARPTYLGGILEMANTRLYPFWGHLTEALTSGRPQNETRDNNDFFAALYQDTDRLREFLAAMDSSANFIGAELAQVFDWASYLSFIDIGGARGGVSARIARSHPHLRAACLDLPAVQPIFDDHMSTLGMTGKVDFHPVDFLADPLPATDVFILGHVLHDWDSSQNQTLIQKAFDALRPGGAILIYDAMIDDERRQNLFGLVMSLNMLVETTGGSEYTAADCKAWLRSAGFEDATSRSLIGPDTLVIGRKPVTDQ